MSITIPVDVMNVLERAELDGPRLRISEQLDRKLYTEVAKVLEAIGGKWNRSQKATVFDGDAAELLEALLQTGEYHRVKQDLGQFDSPPAVVARVMDLTGVRSGMLLLEPNAGTGNIVIAALSMNAHVAAIELDAKRVAKLRDRVAPFDPPVVIRQADFLSCQPEQGFDIVAMNPPFARQADIDHVLHAARFLKPGGRLVSVMASSVMYRINAKTLAFRRWLDQHGGTIELLEPGAFTTSGTQVRACIVAVDL